MLFVEEDFVDFGFEFFFVAGSDGHGWVAVEGDVEDCGDGRDAEGFGDVSAVVDVHFVDYDLAFVFFCQLFEYRCYASAWAAPGCCEVYDCWLGAEILHLVAVDVIYQLGELLSGELYCVLWFCSFLLCVVLGTGVSA